MAKLFKNRELSEQLQLKRNYFFRQEQYSNKLTELTRPATQICHNKFKKPRWSHKPKDWD